MGFVKGVKAADAGQAAAIAARDGRSVFLYRFNIPMTSSGFSGPVKDAPEVIERIERNGWRLDHMAYDPRQSENGAVLLLFRRAAQPGDS